MGTQEPPPQRARELIILSLRYKNERINRYARFILSNSSVILYPNLLSNSSQSISHLPRYHSVITPKV